MADQPLSSPELVAAVITKAVTKRRPRRRYLTGRDARTAGMLAHLLLTLRDRALTRFLGLHRLKPSTSAILPRR